MATNKVHYVLPQHNISVSLSYQNYVLSVTKAQQSILVVQIHCFINVNIAGVSKSRKLARALVVFTYPSTILSFP